MPTLKRQQRISGGSVTLNSQASISRQTLGDFLERYIAAKNSTWSRSLRFANQTSLRHFDEWLKMSKIPLSELTWQKMMDFSRFLQCQGLAPATCKWMVNRAKQALCWGIEQGEIAQKKEELYTQFHGKTQWSNDLPPLSQTFIDQVQVTAPGSYKYQRYAHKVFHTFLKSHNLTYRRLRPENLIAFAKYLKDRGLYQRTRVSICRSIRTYLRWLEEKRKLSRTADDLFPSRLTPKYLRGLPRPIDPQVDIKLQQILKQTEDIIYKGILLARRTGIRGAELRKLEFNCIQYDLKKRASLKIPAVKLGIEHLVPLDEETIELIKQIQQMSIANHKRQTEPKYLVIGPRGQPPTYATYCNALSEILGRLNVKRWFNLHALRHTYATSLLNAGVSITSLKEILGHKTIVMTLVYAKVTNEKIHEEYDKALDNLNRDGVPTLLLPKTQTLEMAFAEIGAHIAKLKDQTMESNKRKQLIAIQNRLSKIKSALPAL